MYSKLIITFSQLSNFCFAQTDHFLGDNLILLVFRYQLKRSEILLMTTNGDTLSVIPLAYYL